MSYGPVELVVLKFDGINFEGEVLREIQKVVDAGTIVVIDILLAVRIGDDPVRVIEIQELEDPDPAALGADHDRCRQPAHRRRRRASVRGPGARQRGGACCMFEHRWVAPHRGRHRERRWQRGPHRAHPAQLSSKQLVAEIAAEA